jgi:CelD/BcsL family acetyltransferase involved in cellulose biosynthesis
MLLALQYKAIRYKSWDSVPAHWHEPSRAPTPFQVQSFLAAWYQNLGAADGVEPVIMEIVTSDTGRPVALFPLIRRKVSGMWEISFADLEVMDNGAPLIGPEFPYEPEAFAMMWRAMTQALPPADVLRLEKIPPRLGAHANPLAGLPGGFGSALTQNQIVTGDDLESYFATRTTKFNKEQRRVWRVFLRNDGAQFEMVEDLDRALALFEQLERLQSFRLRELGYSYRLDEPRYRAFFRQLITEGLRDGSIRFGALTAGDSLVGGLICITNGTSYAFTRICFAPGHWTACSPGRLVLEQTMIALHIEGARDFDLSVGDFAYKGDFGVVPYALTNIVSALSWRGTIRSSAVAVRLSLKESPLAQSIYARLKRFPKCTASGPSKVVKPENSQT